MCIEINNAFLSTLVCKVFCQTNKKSCEDQNNHFFARELNFIFTNSFFYWNISNWQKSFGGIGREISVSRTDFLASPQFGLNPDPAANLQTNNDKKTVKNNKMSQSISSELKTVSHPWLCDHEGRKSRNRMLQEGEVSWSWAECLYRRTITRAQLCLLDPYMGLPLTRHSPLAKEMRGEMPSIIQSSKSSCSNTRCHL